MIQYYNKFTEKKKDERLFGLLRSMVLSDADSIGIFVSGVHEANRWVDAVRNVLESHLDSKFKLTSASPSMFRITFKNGCFIDILQPSESAPSMRYDIVLCDDSISRPTRNSVVERRLRRR